MHVSGDRFVALHFPSITGQATAKHARFGTSATSVRNACTIGASRGKSLLANCRVDQPHGIGVDIDNREPRAPSADVAGEDPHGGMPRSPRAAAWSMSHVPRSASWTGISSGAYAPSSARATVAAFPAPATTTIRVLAA